MSDQEPAHGSRKGNSMNPLTYVAVATLFLRIMHEAPALADDLMAFWAAISGTSSPPEHIDAAIRAAYAAVQAQPQPEAAATGA